MDIKINKDIAKEYPDDTYKGFSVRQLLCIGAAAFLGGGTILILYYMVGLNIHAAVYGAFPLAAPVILVGFIQYKGMPLIDALREWVRLTDQPVMVYEAHENHYDYDENADMEERHYERTHKKHKKRTEKETKRKKRFRRNGGY